MTSIPFQEDILNKFNQALRADQSYAPDWIASWEYQEKRKKRRVSYGEGLPEEFYTFQDPKDLIQWLNWMFNVEKSNFLSGEEFENLAQKSWQFDKEVFDFLDLKVDLSTYESGLGRYNAQDYYFANLTPSPLEGEDLRVLDFGAGFGRQANLWVKNNPNVTYVGMDAIPKSYCLQHFYYSQTGKLRQDYVLDPSAFDMRDAEKGIHHLPTWRWDLLPDNYFDKILLVQVLQEMNARLVKEMIKTFHRVLKPGGALYIRDKQSQFRPAHRLDSDKLLIKSGFVPEYRGHFLHKKEIHGIPRIWRKARPEVLNSEAITFEQRLKEWMLDIDALTNGRLKPIFKKNKK